jgi:hypothetical protein
VTESSDLSVFTTIVPVAFLDKLDNPAKPQPPGSSIDIRWQRLAYKPWETMASRLVASIWDITSGRGQRDTEDGIGSSSPAESSEEEQPVRNGEKRKRPAEDKIGVSSSLNGVMRRRDGQPTIKAAALTLGWTPHCW